MSGILSLLSKGIYSKLTGDTTLKALLASNTSVYWLQAPKDAEYPYIVYSLLYGAPENLTPSDLQDHIYFIRAYAANALEAGNIHARVAALLHKQTVSVTGYTNIWTALEEEYEGEETNNAGNTIFMVGGGFRIRLDS